LIDFVALTFDSARYFGELNRTFLVAENVSILWSYV